MFTVYVGDKATAVRRELESAKEVVQTCLESLGWTDLEYHPQMDNSFHVWGIAAGATDFSFTDVVVYWS
jgi:hypothetical protein